MNQEPGNELEMVNGASKADKAVVEDGYQDDTSTFHKMEKIANAIDKASRFLFPVIFMCFNIFYWTYYQRQIKRKTSELGLYEGSQPFQRQMYSRAAGA